MTLFKVVFGLGFKNNRFVIGTNMTRNGYKMPQRFAGYHNLNMIFTEERGHETYMWFTETLTFVLATEPAFRCASSTSPKTTDRQTSWITCCDVKTDDTLFEKDVFHTPSSKHRVRPVNTPTATFHRAFLDFYFVGPTVYISQPWEQFWRVMQLHEAHLCDAWTPCRSFSKHRLTFTSVPSFWCVFVGVFVLIAFSG